MPAGSDTPPQSFPQREVDTSQYYIQVVLSAPTKFKKLCPKINSLNEPHEQCTVHRPHKYDSISVNGGVYMDVTVAHRIEMWLF